MEVIENRKRFCINVALGEIDKDNNEAEEVEYLTAEEAMACRWKGRRTRGRCRHDPGVSMKEEYILWKERKGQMAG
jgi:hypothetical protein